MAALLILLIAICLLSALLASVLLAVLIRRAALRDRDGRRNSSTVPRYLALFSAIAGITYLWPTRPFLLEGRQIRSHAICQGYYSLLFRHQERHGVFPAALEELEDAERYEPIDGWGNRLHYETDGQSFILASYGRDGEPDGSDYDFLRRTGTRPPGYSICGNYDADEVLSDQGWHRLCGR